MTDTFQLMLTLDTWARDYLRPSMLAQFGLPDTEAGNAVLDDMVAFAFKVDCNPMDIFTPAVRAELLKRYEAAHTAPPPTN